MIFIRFAAIFFLVGVAPLAAPAWADEQIDVIQPLSFGNIVLRNNNASYAVTVTPQGAVVYPPQVIAMEKAKNAVYELRGYEPNTELFVQIAPPRLVVSCNCGGPDFIVENFKVEPEMPRTDASGNATVKVGATLRTQAGGGQPYPAGNFSGNLTLIVNN